jgi:hypothetical protein
MQLLPQEPQRNLRIGVWQSRRVRPLQAFNGALHAIGERL